MSFMNSVIKTHLLEHAKTLLGLSEEEIKWQHGVIALRCYAHLKESFEFPEAEPESEHDDDGDGTASVHSGQSNASGEDTDDGDDTDDEDGENSDNGDGSDADGENEESSGSESEYSEDEEDDEAYVDPEKDILIDKAFGYTVKHWLRHASKATHEISEDLSKEDEFVGYNLHFSFIFFFFFMVGDTLY